MDTARFLGYQNTHLLWNGCIREDVPKSFKLPKLNQSISPSTPFKRVRLGKLTESFFFSELELVNSINVLAKNIQIRKDKITIGELDCIIAHHSIIKHIELVYKFYLYDELDPTNELVNWIGPNRKDSLMEKLDKLANKQFPLIEREETKQALAELAIPQSDTLEQYTYFKAQLFIPYNQTVSFDKINKDCVEGFYLNLSDLNEFSHNTFFIPDKLDWLSQPQADINYQGFPPFLVELNHWLSNEKSPMCWMRSNDGTLSKLFVVWW
jgi:hypothetical protein